MWEVQAHSDCGRTHSMCTDGGKNSRQQGQCTCQGVCSISTFLSCLPSLPFLFKGSIGSSPFFSFPSLPLRWQGQQATERGHWDGGGDRQGRSLSKQSTHRDHASQVSPCWGKGVRTLDGVTARAADGVGTELELRV